ncbi:hypothetical protein CHS0354_035480 [Potamilus streckersoni]|uniref:Uncharacterized protein n=1 Tax=Potamilus streckersoni TaxID=2493646 RepID=A0AAE0RVG8_9BIVA|nr:hypothetical protein CHS0354_035480 [Potamilus streckersoni]
MTAKNKDTKIITKLEKVPFSFKINIKSLMRRQANILLIKLRREYECQEYEHHEEIKRYYNLTTYLHYICGNVKEAKQCNQEALEKDPESIVALGNKAWIQHRENKCNEDLKEVENIIIKVEALCLNREKLLVAKAEIAYSYARFGMMYYKQAESIYREVLAEVIDGDKLPTVLWQYGCGLLNRRILAQTIYGFKENIQEYEDRIMRAADLLFKVAKNGTNYRLMARAWAELGNLAFAQQWNQRWITLIPKDLKRESVYNMFIYADLTNKQISDIPVLEQCANYLRKLREYDECERLLRNSLKVKESSRAYLWLAEVLKIQLMKNLNVTKEGKPEWIPDCEKTREILKIFDAAIATEQNFIAMECKGKFLMEMGKIIEAVNVFNDIYRLVNTTEIQPEECDHNVKVFCQIYVAKCLLYLSSDEKTIKLAKDLLRFSIETTVGVRQKREQRQNLTDNQSPTTSSMTKPEFDGPGLPRLSKLLNDAVEEMQKLLEKGKKTKESVFDEIALCELLGDKRRVYELCRELEGMNIDTDDQLEFVQVLIRNREFGKGLFHLNQMIVCGKWPQEMNEFAIEAHVDGAMDAMKTEDLDLVGARLRAAFDLKFPKKDITPERENLDIFLIANECKRDYTWKLQELFGHLTKLEITSCFETMQAGLIFKSTENSIEQCSIVAILLGEGDLTNRDPDSELFQMMVESARMTCNEKKVLIVITLSELRVMPFCLVNVPCLELIEPLQNGKEWMHTFFRQTLIK